MRAIRAGGSPTPLDRDVLHHLDEQIESAQRLLGSMLSQGAAIRERDVEGVLARLADIKVEMELRSRLESDRTDLLARAGAPLGVPAAAVTLEAMSTLMTPGRGRARERAQRRAARPARRGGTRARHQPRPDAPGAVLPRSPRAAARAASADGGYRPEGARPRAPAAAHHVLDLQA